MQTQGKIEIADEEIFNEILRDVCRDSRFCESKNYMQHGSISVYTHSITVAYYSCWIAEHYDIKVRKRELIRGALLHDYFLYDWHKDKEEGRHLHGFTHPATALKNASEDFELTPVEKDIIKKHAIPNAKLPMVTIIAINIGFMIAGAMQVETVFSWPGIGRLMYDALSNRDYPLLQGIFFIISVSVVLANLIADILYSYLDPRIKN